MGRFDELAKCLEASDRGKDGDGITTRKPRHIAVGANIGWNSRHGRLCHEHMKGQDAERGRWHNEQLLSPDHVLGTCKQNAIKFVSTLGIERQPGPTLAACLGLPRGP